MRFFRLIWRRIRLIPSRLKEMMKIRLIFLDILTVVLFIVLLVRLYDLQILEPAEEDLPPKSDTSKIVQSRYMESVRGNIYDRKGNLLAYNVQSYSVVMTNSALTTNNEQKNSMILLLLKLLEENGYEPELTFEIEQNEYGKLVFNVSGNAELRFKKNAYGLQRISDLSEEQQNATAEEVFEFLRKGTKNVSMYGISDEYPIDVALKIMMFRYKLFNLYPQYSQFTVCTNVDDKLIAAIMENSADLPGVEIKQQTTRVYNDSIFFAHILGYTGQMNDDEAENMNSGYDDPIYSTSDVIGKTGIEKEYDEVLRGKKGEVQLVLSSSGKVQSQTIKKEPKAGNDVYLTIDREMQIACYHILENNIAAILISKIVNSMDYGGKGTSANKITIPIYEVYNAFFENGMIDIPHLSSPEATALEKNTRNTFLERMELINSRLKTVLAFNSTDSAKDISDELQGYIDYIYQYLKKKEVVLKDKVDTKSSVYIEYTEGDASLSELLRYGINNGWINLELLGIGSDYNTNEEIYARLLDYALEGLVDNSEFERLVYRQLIFNHKLSGRDCCLLLYDQGFLEMNQNDYNRLANGSIAPYTFVIDKLKNLEITPGMLALEPCSGSVVITDVNTGDIRALVTYPSYDANKLANKIDWNYYQKLLNNKATPLLNRTTQQMTTTGSTFKPLMALAGLGEGVISTSTLIEDKGVFEEVDPSPKCWKYPNSHGNITLTQAIQHSCNYFFYKVGYEMSLDSKGEYSDSQGIAKIQKYATMFGLAEKSGVELPESMPTISSTDAVRTSIGYYHSFAPIQISRYVTAIANKGTVYNLTLVDKVYNREKEQLVDNQASVYNKIDRYSNSEWASVQQGMYNVVNTSTNSLDVMYSDLGFKVAGKTGTAQVSLTHPSNGLFVSFAPYESPEVSVTVVLPNGYTSANAAKLAREVYGLYFNGENKEGLLSGDIKTTTVTNIDVSD
ncbi:MAG: peptidase [Lachnospiraceae bacterium]|nr:peptidase [Lachnospiraceae bacterium]